MNTLSIRNLCKTYANGVKALDDVSLTIGNGMFGLLGPNGAGKSTLMRTIAALQEPSSGSITFNDKNIVDSPQQVRSQLGYLPQEFGVYPRISARSLLDYLAVLKGIADKKDRKEQVESLLHQTNLYQHRKKAVHTFSGGMRQRFGIAQALLGDPQLIIVDEPTAGLDPEERNRFFNLLSEIGEHVIVILSTHIVEDVRDLCEQMAIMGEGRIIVQGNPSELTQNLENKVWVKTISRQAISEYKQEYNIISTRLNSGKTQIRVYAESDPGAGFLLDEPGLESVYFSALFDYPVNNK